MKFSKPLLSLSFLIALGLGGCSNNPTPSNTSKEPEEPSNRVQVVVMSGQSNMHGSTYWKNGNQEWLKDACSALEDEGHSQIDVDSLINGIPEIQCSFRGYYPYSGASAASGAYCSNNTDKMAGKFLDLKVGMGNKAESFGPELGMANVLRDNGLGEEDKPIFFIKSAFSGSSFKQQSGAPTKHWKIADDNNGTEGELWTETKEYVYNNLKLIEDMGYEPVIKAWCWHQGESDTDNNEQSGEEQYGLYMRNLLAEFREEFTEYALDQDGENIAFVDCTIYDGDRITYSGVDTLNQTKLSISEDSDNNYLINGSMKEIDGLGEGLKLQIGGYQNLDGCFDTYHYITKDLFRLGEAYGQILVDNEIIK